MVWVGRYLKAHSVPTPCHMTRTPSNSYEVQLVHLQVHRSHQLGSFIEPFWYRDPRPQLSVLQPMREVKSQQDDLFLHFILPNLSQCGVQLTELIEMCHVTFLSLLLSMACDGEERRHSPYEKQYCLKCPCLCKGFGVERGRCKLAWYPHGSGSAVPK